MHRMEINYGLQIVVFPKHFTSLGYSYHLICWVNFVEDLTAVCGEELISSTLLQMRTQQILQLEARLL